MVGGTSIFEIDSDGGNDDDDDDVRCCNSLVDIGELLLLPVLSVVVDGTVGSLSE